MSYLVLAMDTATDASALALGERDGDAVSVIATGDFEAPRAALGRLLPAARELLAAHSLAPADIDEIVVGRGPGSFTGVRIGVATAKGLAHGRGVPLFGIGTLDAIAWSCADHEGLLGVVGDAMRGEVYPALFELADGQVRRLEDDRVRFPSHAADDWAAVGELMLVGNGLRKHLGEFQERLGERARVLPERLWRTSGEGLLAAYADARRRGRQGDGDPAAVLPVYTRLSDAEETERAQAGSATGESAPDSGVRGPGPGGTR